MATEQRVEVPNLGRLLLTAFRSVVDELINRLAEAGYTDLRSAHSRVFENLPDAGARVSDLAERAQMTHQSMSELVLHLERRGYLERRPDPTDGRAKIVVLTARGQELSHCAAACMEAIEDNWARRLGAQRMRDLRASLEEAVPTTPES